jgi:hypothetical protein
MPQSFGGNVVLVDVHTVIEQIADMERARHSQAVSTNSATQFDTGPLKGLWHKHWFQASFMPENLANEMKRHGAALIFKRLSERYGRNGWSSPTIDRQMVDLLAHATVFDTMDRRVGNTGRGSGSRLTGEWIVFARTGARNVYLTLGGHHETNEAILARCLPAQREFSELASLEPFNMYR